MQEKKLEKANLMRAKRKSIMLGKDDSLQISDDTIDAPNDDNQNFYGEAGEHLPNLSKGQEENSEDQELVNFIRSTAWSNYEIPKSVLMEMAQEEQLHKDMKASFIQKILHKYKSKVTDSPVFRQMVDAIKYYYIQKSKALSRELFRFQYQTKPRYVCARCRMGFRFASQLNDHTENNGEVNNQNMDSNARSI